MIIAYVPGTHAQFWAVWRNGSSGRSGWAITSIDHCRPSAARPPPTAHSATSHDTG